MGRKKLTPIEVRPLPTSSVQSARGSTRPSGARPTRSLPGVSSAMRQVDRRFPEAYQVDQGAGQQERHAEPHGYVEGVGGGLQRLRKPVGIRRPVERADPRRLRAQAGIEDGGDADEYDRARQL